MGYVLRNDMEFTETSVEFWRLVGEPIVYCAEDASDMRRVRLLCEIAFSFATAAVTQLIQALKLKGAGSACT